MLSDRNLNNKRVVYIAEYSDYGEYEQYGIFATEFDAFLACLMAHNKEKQWYREVYTNKDDRRMTFNDKWMIYEMIKKLGKYQITKEEVKSFLPIRKK